MTVITELPGAWQPQPDPPGRETEKDGTRHYIYPPTGERLVSVTTVLGATDGKQRYLVPWSARLAAECAIENFELLRKIAADEGMPAAVKHAAEQSERIRQVKADAGSHVHHVVEALVLWAASPERTGAEIVLPSLPEHLEQADYDGEPLPEVTDWMIDGFLNWVADFGPEFLAAEMAVYNQPLGIAGTLDIIAALHGYGIGRSGRLVASPSGIVVPCIDVKTGRNLDVTWREQIAGYRRCPECFVPVAGVQPMPTTTCAAVLHLRPEHPRGYRLMLISGQDDEAAWQTFRSALATYKGRQAARPKPGKVCYPLRADGTIPQPLLADLDGEGYGRVLSPLVKAGVSDLEQVAAMDAGDVLKVKGIAGKGLETVRLMLADHGLSLRGEASA